jgi:hypothetical protein
VGVYIISEAPEWVARLSSQTQPGLTSEVLTSPLHSYQNFKLQDESFPAANWKALFLFPLPAH